ncbi:protein cueball isoform X1 [Ostrinia furnacalis]|uniref:protein cueball isoform X1 n=1 Tax=Ostrinia furnacalis TaxID=93504 RepID=UPI00103BFAD8|nr:protein cueball isoform X1 [Ostrinia furnacalis]
MCKTEILLAVVALSIGLVNSWDIAITNGDQLEFYSNQTKTSSEGTRFRDLTALAYDAVHNMLLFVDKENDNASIFSFHLATKKYQSLVRRRSYENIQGLAFDPVKGMLFWTDTNAKSIFWMSLMLGTKNDVYGNLLIKMNDEIPRAIAVDSCRGYIYWTNTNITNPTIERSRFDGSEREVIVNTDIYMPVSIAIDQGTKRLYWADDKEGIHFSIESSNLEGKDRQTLLRGVQHQPNALTVSKDSIYWVDLYKKIWKLAKDKNNAEPFELLSFSHKAPFGVIANYQVSNEIEGIPECDALSRMSKNKTAINDSFNIPKDRGLFCLYGVKVEGKLACKCSPGYIGDRCEISVCSNYCLQGDCSLTPGGEPTCSCKHGYKGEKCEVDVCSQYCLNNGVCTVNKDQIPECQCSGDYEGQRCEMVKAAPIPAATNCNCTKETRSLYQAENSVQTDGEFVEPSECTQGWDTVRDPVIVVLGVLCGLLCVACTVLITKVLQLKRRPRIKKRIIVNKNVTPMTARPDQCEITIENCCNMNICETPCFEPRSTIRPTLGDAKPGKEEKKNLIANMELPDEY